MEDIKTIVKAKEARLTHVCNAKVYYQIDTDNHSYQLEIDSLDNVDWKNTHILPSYKPLNLMRWIRKGIESNDGTFILIK